MIRLAYRPRMGPEEHHSCLLLAREHATIRTAVELAPQALVS